MSFALKDEPIENLRPLKVRCIGAGYSGIYLGIRIPQQLRNVDFQIYEKNEGVGGTWLENRYPGCACDIPSHSYQYSFAPNPDWSAFYAPALEIYEYLHGVAEKYGVMRHVKLQHKVKTCVWDDGSKKWKLKIENVKTGELIADDADIVISARGSLNEPAWPQIPGLDTFKGEVMHSAAWNQSYDFKNKKVGVIGGGSSSIQIVPNLREIEGIKLSCFVRSKTWISNPFGDSAMIKLGLDPHSLDFTPEQRKEFADNPQSLFKFRKAIELEGNTIHHLLIKSSEMQLGAVQSFTASMKERLALKPEIFESLIPSFAVGCRRLTPGPGYLEALVSDNVDFITKKISSIGPNSIVTEDGKATEIDALICATGFDTSARPPFEVVGLKGKTLTERFTPYPESYLTMAVDGFPNYFMMNGPNGAVGSGSLTIMLENEGDYIVKCLRKLQKEDYVTMMPKAERVRDFVDYMTAYFKNTVHMDECRSWYRTGDRITGLWPGSALHCLETLRAPRWEDFEYESRAENKLRWLGNGFSAANSDGGGDAAWYLEPSLMNLPLAGRPEDDAECAIRAFSH